MIILIILVLPYLEAKCNLQKLKTLISLHSPISHISISQIKPILQQYFEQLFPTYYKLSQITLFYHV